MPSRNHLGLDRRPFSEAELTRFQEMLRDGTAFENDALLHAAFSRLAPTNIHDIWHPEGVSTSYWVLMLNGINSAREQRIASELLLWKECFAGPDAQVRCLQSSEREKFGYACRHFDVTAPPVLIVANDPVFHEFLKIDAALLERITEKEHGLQGFLTKVHNALMNDHSLQSVTAELESEKFWQTMKVLYKEAKGLFSIQVTNG